MSQHIDKMMSNAPLGAENIQQELVKQTVEGLPVPKYWFGNVVGFNHDVKGPLACVVTGAEWDEQCKCGHAGWHYVVREQDPLTQELTAGYRLAEDALIMLTLKGAH